MTKEQKLSNLEISRIDEINNDKQKSVSTIFGFCISIATFLYFVIAERDQYKFILELINMIIYVLIFFRNSNQLECFCYYLLFIINQSTANYYKDGFCLYSNVMRQIQTYFYIRFQIQKSIQLFPKHLKAIIDVFHNTFFMLGEIYQSRNGLDLIIYFFVIILIILYYKHEQKEFYDNDETKEKIEEDDKDMCILNDFIHQMSKSSGILILKMKYQSSKDTDQMVQKVQKFDNQAKRMLKADNQKKMLDRFKNSEFELVDEVIKKNEDLLDFNQIKKPLEYWIRKAAAQLIMQKEQEEIEKQNQIQQGLKELNPASSILNLDHNLQGKAENLDNQKVNKDSFDQKKINTQKETAKIWVIQNNAHQSNIGSALGLVGGFSAYQNSTLPYGSNLQPHENGMNEMSNFQSFLGSNLNNNYNNVQNNHINSDDQFQQLLSPKSNGNLLQIYTAKSNDKQNEETALNPQNISLQNNIDQNNNIEQAYQIFKKENEQKDKDLKQKMQGDGNLLNDMTIKINNKETKISSHKKHHKEEKQNEERSEADKNEVKLSKSKQNMKIHSKQNLTAQEDKENEEPIIEYSPKRNFTIEQFKGVLFIKKKAEVFRRVTIGSFMEGDDIFVLLSIQKDFQTQEKKINQLRELLNQYESLYLQTLKCLKNLTYDAYLDIPAIETEEKLKNNFETILNKNQSLNLQMKIIMNKIINLKDVLNLQKSIQRNKLQVEVIDLMDLLNELTNDFKSILEEKNVTIQILNPSNITTIQNSPKRVKQVLFNILHNAIKNTESNYFVQITIDYYQENNKIIQFHIINKIKQNIQIPTKDDVVLDIKEILKGVSKMQIKRSKTKKDRSKNSLQIGLRVSNKILSLIGPKSSLIMKKVDNTFQTQVHIFSDASQQISNEKLIKKEKEQKTKQEEVEDVLQDSWLQKMETYLQDQRILALQKGIEENKINQFIKQNYQEN
ncbi:transmembrane protein, putative (macronuclear) [Tetrahymena thermophila SB210]|uniref:Transmembrane protein, putative n=1 Tax=Tetrahymena thermophila (strain SB210) TaxID=312017 RepID=Q24BW2_TETTS|nr:transmembrane protein, putative [Tetrahymena thermophila SB210]EAS05275.2 transmembrane protein, putative [Tetrahymena thermophila SB210]|eukprot:XP_001025520.2 transmembrane protein, putative [Tetrahymena thermophila SB210]